VAVPLPTTNVLVIVPGAAVRDAHGRRVHAGAPTTRGPYPAHVTWTPQGRLEAGGELRTCTVDVDLAAWPVDVGMVLLTDEGDRLTVTGAARRPGTAPAVAHVYVTAQLAVRDGS
jgi:hypothetical protein